MGFVNQPVNPGDVIFETYRQKHYIKVSAVHVKTGVEISVLCPINATETILQYVALSKLEYIMKKKQHINGILT